MLYDEFRDQLQKALQDVDLFLELIGKPIETIELSHTQRRWKVYSSRSSQSDAEPFHVSAKIAFNWNPVDSARSYTCEEDLLTELLGRKKRPFNTAERFIRVDLELQASLPYGSTTTISDPQIFGSWTDSVSLKLDKLLTEHSAGASPARLWRLRPEDAEALSCR